MLITDRLDSGNIGVTEICDDALARLTIRTDTGADFRQWFHFRVEGERGVERCFEIVNARSCAYPEGWEHYRVVASYDGEDWFRIATEYVAGILRFKHCAQQYATRYAYFQPYSQERHLGLLDSTQSVAGVTLHALGRSIEGRIIHVLQFEPPAGPSKSNRTVWIIARQHPGETMGQWCAEGMVEALCAEKPETAIATLRQNATVYIVPCMNPDGACLGNLRSNAAGANLNREWQSPTLQRSPEVFHVRKLMQQTGCDLFLDLHGDEAIPHVFASGASGVPGFDATAALREKRFADTLLSITDDFQTTVGYPPEAPGTANLDIASNWMAQHFKCLSLTLEMPFKDHDERADERHGWSGERSRALGRALLQAIAGNISL